MKRSDRTVRFVVSMSMICASLLLLTFHTVNAATVTSTRSGNWNTGSTWTGGAVPASTDVVVIAKYHTVNTNGNRTCAGLTITGTLTTPGGALLTVNGNVGGTGSWSTGSSASTISLTGNWTFKGTSSGNGAAVICSGPNTQSLSGVISTGTGDLTINKNGGSAILAGALSVKGVFTVSAGTFDASAYLLTAGSAVLTSGELRVGAAEWASNYSFKAEPQAGFRINYYNPSAIFTSSFIYEDLRYSGSGTAGAAGALIIKGDLENTGGGTLNFGSQSVTVVGTDPLQSIAGFTTRGIVTMAKSAGTAALSGNVNGGSFILLAPKGTLKLGSGLTHTFSGTISCLAGTIDCGSSTVNLGGAVIALGGTWIAGTGTVNFTSANAQIIPNIPFYDIGFSGSGIKTIASGAALHVGRHCDVNAPITLASDADMTVAGNITGGGSITMGSGSISVGGNWTNNGPFTCGTGTVIYTGGADQLMGALAYQNLTINKSDGSAMLGGPAVVNGTLAFTNGKIATRIHTLTLGSSAVVSGAGTDKYVQGSVSKKFTAGTLSFTYPIGDSSAYTPVTVTFANITKEGFLTLTTIPGQHPQVAGSGLDAAKDVNRYWTLANNGIACTSYSAAFTFGQGDIAAGADPSALVIRRYDAPSWNAPIVGTRTSTSVQATGLNTFGDFAIGCLQAAPKPVTANIKVFLSGAYADGSMTTSLSALGRIPLSSDLAYAGSTYGCTQKRISTFPQGCNIVDWVLVELRSGPVSSTRVAVQAGLLTNTGVIVDTNGISPLAFAGVESGSYYLVVRHRNHLAVMSAAAVTLSADSPLYDFTSGPQKAYGTHATADLKDGAFGMWAGDVNRNGIVRYAGSQNDRSAVQMAVGLTDPSASIPGYLDADVNLDGVVRFTGRSNDSSVILRSVGLTDPNASVASQIPN